MVLLVVALVMLGTATKLKNAKKIELSGAVSGNANFDGSGNVNIVTTQSNIAILTGVLSVSDTSGLWEAKTTYPTGYNKDNSVVLSLMIKSMSTTATTWSNGSVFNSSNSLTGSIPARVRLGENNIFVDVRNILLSNEIYPTIPTASGTFDFKLVLMKIS